jgi:AbrB family looped-hinge helix DNA binding protein
VGLPLIRKSVFFSKFFTITKKFESSPHQGLSEARRSKSGFSNPDFYLLIHRGGVPSGAVGSSPVQNLITNEVRYVLLIGMDVAITRMSSKGQVVIPASMRADLPEGEKILIIREGERIILKPLTDLEPTLREDILFAEQTEKAFEDYSKGSFTKKKAGEFISEMDSW